MSTIETPLPANPVPLGIFPCTREEYFADPSASNTGLKTLADSPAMFNAMFNLHTLPFKDTKSLRIGSYGHEYIFEPERFARYVSKPECDRRTKIGKDIYAEFQLSLVADGKLEADEKELATAKAMREAVFANAEARAWLECDGEHEHAIRWQDEETGLVVKNRRDKVLSLDEIILDLKSMAKVPSPENFAYDAARLRYHWQDGLYSRGHEVVYGVRPKFIFIGVCSKPPHDVGCHVLEDEDIERGISDTRAKLKELAWRIETDNWLPSWSAGVNRVALPRHVRYQSEYDLEDYSNGDS
jgi:hypothetical protein